MGESEHRSATQEAEKAASDHRFRLLVEGVLDYAIFMLDPQGRITSWNPGAAQLTGYTEQEVLGRPLAIFFSEEEVAMGLPEGVLRLAAAQGRVEDEGWRVRKDGSRFLAHGIITAFRDAQGDLLGFAKVTRDITEPWTTQEALRSLTERLEERVATQVRELRESEMRLQGFIRHSPAGIAFKGLDGRFLLVNPRMEAMLGLPAGEILDRRNEDLFAPETCGRARSLEDKVLATGQEIQVEEEWTDREGRTHQSLAMVFPMIDGSDRCWGLGVIATDLTERRKAELALLQSQKLEALGVLVGGIAHDFNNLLGAMHGNVELALAEPLRARPHLETLGSILARASDLVHQMLAYAGQAESRLGILDLNRLVEEMTQLLRASISKKARLTKDLHPGPLTLEGDPARIQQVVMNLVINASEALAERNGHIILRTRLEELDHEALTAIFDGRSFTPGLHVSLEVTDNGTGMAPEVLDRIFDPFFTTKFTGRGLGLAALLGIVRSHRGAVQVLSAPGRGSTFRLVFPAAAGPVSVPEAAPPLPRVAYVAPGLTLVVDDEDAMRAVAVQALERSGFPTLQARDGQEALQLWGEQRERISLVLMDLTMPGLDGAEA